jgi:hypothetical protein
MSVRMILTVDDPDSVFARAVAAGATEVAPISEDYGWRIGRIADPFGHLGRSASGSRAEPLQSLAEVQHPEVLAVAGADLLAELDGFFP